MSTVSWARADAEHGDVRPLMEALPMPTQDARSVALGALAGWISTLRFLRAGNIGGPPIPFRLPKQRVHQEQPDDAEQLRFPCAVFVPQRGLYVSGIGGGDVDDATRDVWAPDSVVLGLGEYTESVAIELWASKKAERRALIAGLETAMQTAESTQMLRLRLPGYFNTTATFALSDQERIDEPDAVRNRRRARLYVTLSVPVLRLVHVVTLRPYLVDQGDLDDDTSA